MAEWEKMKQENERKRMEDIRKRVHQQTDTLFADFDEATKSGLLEELEKVMVSAAIKEEKRRAAEERPKVIKVTDIDKKVGEAEGAESEDLIKKKLLKEAVEKAKDFEDFENKLNPLVARILDEDEEETEDLAQKPVEEAVEELTQKFVETADELVKPNESDSAKSVEKTDGEEAQESVDHSADSDTKEGEVTPDLHDNKPKASLKGIKKGPGENSRPEGKAPKEKKEKRAKQEEEEKENKSTVREMTNSEREQFAPFIHHKKTRRQIVETIDNISMASYTGNVIITGEEGTIELAKLLVKEIQLSDNNFSGKVAKISGLTMNKKDIQSTLSKLSGGALIIEGAASMKKATVEQLLKELNQEDLKLEKI